MELNVEEVDKVRRKLQIKIPESVVGQRVDRAYLELNKQIRMPGFRPGKIPKKILEKQVPLEALTELWQSLMQEYYEKALVESGIVPAGPPEIDHAEIKQIKRDEPLTFSVLLDIKPSIKFKDYKGLKFKKREFAVTDAELETSIKEHLQPLGRFEVLDDDHVVQEGDFLALDFDGFIDGELLENSTARNYEMKVGEKKMIKGFEGQLIGHKKGEEFEVKVVLPQDWNQKMRRVSMPIPGKEGDQVPDLATFKVKIKEIKKFHYPELNDELVRAQGEDSVDAFKRKLRAHIQGMKDHAEEARIKQEIFDHLVKTHDVEPPESVVKQEIKFMIDGMKFQIERSGMKVEDSGFDPKKAEEEWREKAELDAKGYVILDGIANQENLHVSQADLEEEYQRLSQQTGKTLQEVKDKLFAHPAHMNQTTQRVRGRKALNLIYSHCEFEYVPADADLGDKQKKESPAGANPAGNPPREVGTDVEIRPGS
ncbi:MAG: trigger factor [Nitrospinaceae bacterium]